MITGVKVCWDCFYEVTSLFSYCPLCGGKLKPWSEEYEKANLKNFYKRVGGEKK